MTWEERHTEIVDAAKQHGEDSEPDHEVGDLQDALREAMSLMDGEQLDKLMGSEAVENILAWGED